MKFERHKQKNKTNRNLFIIGIGFLCFLFAGGFVLQNFMNKTKNSKNKYPHTLYISIVNQSRFTQIPYNCIINSDTILQKSISNKKQSYEIDWKWDSLQTVTNKFGRFSNKIKNVQISDSVGYLSITLKNDLINHTTLLIEASFFK